MARYTGPTTRIIRRFGQHLLGSGKALDHPELLRDVTIG